MVKPESKKSGMEDEAIVNLTNDILDAVTIVFDGQGYNNRLQAHRILYRQLSQQKIQGVLDRQGDIVWNSFVDEDFPSIPGDTASYQINKLLKTNWFMNRVFLKTSIPIEKYHFINEKISRKSKVDASLLEFFVGFIWLIYKETFTGMRSADRPREATARTKKRIRSLFEVLKIDRIEIEKELAQYLNEKREI